MKQKNPNPHPKTWKQKAKNSSKGDKKTEPKTTQ